MQINLEHPVMVFPLPISDGGGYLVSQPMLKLSLEGQNLVKLLKEMEVKIPEALAKIQKEGGMVPPPRMFSREMLNNPPPPPPKDYFDKASKNLG